MEQQAMKWNELSEKARERFLSEYQDDFFAQHIVDYYTGDSPDPSVAELAEINEWEFEEDGTLM
jgi:hypothetical protein